MTRFTEWRKRFFSTGELSNPAISGENADPDQDGNNNLMEYALLGDPTAPDAALTRMVVNFPAAAGGGVLSATYSRRKNASDMAFKVVASSDGRSWEPLDETVTQDHGLTESVTAQDKGPPSAFPQRFVRLQIQHIPG
jgi:hypothetical protein